jgi:hypothetical protein
MRPDPQERVQEGTLQRIVQRVRNWRELFPHPAIPLQHPESRPGAGKILQAVENCVARWGDVG